ncbi:MAG TPA: 30S ribosomal protein S8 [Candidatus Dormibacteraeota bacterium]|nr:30S ribosomal protein S8 [Candidatus Dormibacteraeota bacterium]
MAGTITDPIADLLTRIRNANQAGHVTVDIPASRMKRAVADILKDEGYVREVEVISQAPQDTLRVHLKYGPNREKVITGLRRISRPGLRIYTNKAEIPRVMGGLGLVIMSTSKGIMSGKRAKREGFGGEVLAYVW